MRRLVLSPHADDEVLGCSSVLDRETFVHYAAIDEFHIVPREERLREVGAVAAFFGFAYSWDERGVVNRLVMQDLIGTYEALVNEHRPEEIFVPYGDGYNQDHRAVFRAARVALRPHDRNHFVPRVLVYEQPDVLWADVAFPASYFFPLDLERKCAALRLHASQMRGHRALDLVEAMARLRGEQAGCRHAEAFAVLRSVEGGPARPDPAR